MIGDNDLVDMVLRAVKGVEVNKDTVAADIIAEVGPGGHFLVRPHTAAHICSEFYFPSLSDRLQRIHWEAEGSKDAFTRAKEETKRILEECKPFGLGEDVEKILREKYPGIK